MVCAYINDCVCVCICTICEKNAQMKTRKLMDELRLEYTYHDKMIFTALIIKCKYYFCFVVVVILSKQCTNQIHPSKFTNEAITNWNAILNTFPILWFSHNLLLSFYYYFFINTFNMSLEKLVHSLILFVYLLFCLLS